MPSYVEPDLVISLTSTASKDIVRELQVDLRKLGYLRAGVDGVFGHGTEAAVRAFQHDLLNNQGLSSGGDGNAPIAMTTLNVCDTGTWVQSVNGVVDQNVATCLANVLADPRVPKLPDSDDPVAANKQAMDSILSHVSPISPSLFLAAIAQQESGGYHYSVPRGTDIDNVITVGLDRNGQSPDSITSRGYGLGQYTLFHHPPRPEEVADFMVDAVKNVEKARSELRHKLDNYVAGPADHADDRIKEVGNGAIRICRYDASDKHYMVDCANCIMAAKRLTINETTPWYSGSSNTYTPTNYHPATHYNDVPDRSDIGCDWPYAVRRYNGSGVNSFHYQAQVMLILAKLADQ